MFLQTCVPSKAVRRSNRDLPSYAQTGESLNQSSKRQQQTRQLSSTLKFFQGTPGFPCCSDRGVTLQQSKAHQEQKRITNKVCKCRSPTALFQLSLSYRLALLALNLFLQLLAETRQQRQTRKQPRARLQTRLSILLLPSATRSTGALLEPLTSLTRPLLPRVT